MNLETPLKENYCLNNGQNKHKTKSELKSFKFETQTK